MKRLKIGLLARIIIAITLGIGFGNVLPGELVRVFVTFNGIFSEFLGFIIPLIILGLVTPAIADIGKEAGKMLVITTLVAYSATLFSGFLSYFTGVTFFPSMITPGAPIEQISEAHDISPFFTVAIPPVMNVMTSLILAFTLGLGIAHLDSTALKNVCNDFKEIIVKTIQTVIYNPQIQISAESETKRSIFREKDKTKRSKKESAQHSKSRNKSFVMTSVSAL